jgi:DNA repair protein RadA/Sms
MAKTKTSFFCQDCGTNFAKWQGQCSSCQSWNSISEEVIQKKETTSWKPNSESKTTATKPLLIHEIEITHEKR